jgi:hypothetical protein
MVIFILGLGENSTKKKKKETKRFVRNFLPNKPQQMG